MLDAARTAPHGGRNIAALPNSAAQAPPSGAGRLACWHRITLCILALVSLFGQSAVQMALHVPPAETAVQAARQQALAQHLVLSAQATQASNTPAERTAWETELRETAETWKQSAGTGADKSAMLEAAASLLAALPPDTSRRKVDVSPELAILLQHQKGYADSQEKALEDGRAASDTYFAHLRGLSAGLCAATLLLLLAFGLAARPGAWKVGQTLTELSDLEERKREQDAALGQADRQIAQMRETLENLSTVDSLTGLRNHRALHEQLDREMGRAQRHGQPLSLLLLAVDKFKSYNDSYGYAEGDQALKAVAGLLREAGRASDVPARYGGREFALILTETDMMGAVVLGERLRQAIASADSFQRPLTASIGIATLTPNIFSVAALLAQADRALCHAKGEGRNRVSHAHHLPAPLEDEAPSYAQAA